LPSASWTFFLNCFTKKFTFWWMSKWMCVLIPGLMTLARNQQHAFPEALGVADLEVAGRSLVGEVRDDEACAVDLVLSSTDQALERDLLVDPDGDALPCAEQLLQHLEPSVVLAKIRWSSWVPSSLIGMTMKTRCVFAPSTFCACFSNLERGSGARRRSLREPPWSAGAMPLVW
jgi:hypothetical protein